MTASPNTDIQVGDTVRLASGGPAMVVTRIDYPSQHYHEGSDVLCSWFGGNELCTNVFLNKTLRKTQVDVR